MKLAGSKSKRFFRGIDWTPLVMSLIVVAVLAGICYGVFKLVYWDENERDIRCNEDYMTKTEMIEYCGAEFPNDAPVIYKR